MWQLLLIILVVITLGYVFHAYFKDRRDLGKKTVQSIGDELWKEIDHERHDSVEKGKMFRRILDKKRKESR